MLKNSTEMFVEMLSSKAAVPGGAMNVYTNTGSMKNREKAELFNQRADALREKAALHAQTIYKRIEEALRCQS